MGKYKKMLVAVDGSESGKNALRQAIKLANSEESWITVVSVIPAYQGDLGSTVFGNVIDAMREPYEKALSDAVEIAKSESALIKTVCEEGEIYERIVDLADAENCDLIVMGRKGRSQIEKALIGSVTARVIGHSQRDVLVVPLNTVVGWKSIFLTTDGSKYSEAATDKAINFAKSYGGELMVLSVVDVTEEFMARSPGTVEEMVKKAKGFVEDVKKKAEAFNINTKTFVREGEAYKKITDLAREHKANVIFMGSHGRTGLKRLLMGSVAEKVIGHAPCPVFIAKT
jgi:nucleotide-binding universal stress UspA family protein